LLKINNMENELLKAANEEIVKLKEHVFFLQNEIENNHYEKMELLETIDKIVKETGYIFPCCHNKAQSCSK
jgi:hypothetical protein